jgi:CYTH domain-containing protein
MLSISPTYILGTRLRLRKLLPSNGGEPIMKLTCKADADPPTRVLTSIYPTPEEFSLLATLPGQRIKKTRHYLRPMDGVTMSVDAFEGALSGLFLAEAEFENDSAMRKFSPPEFAIREVTDDPRYAGGSLSHVGLPTSDRQRT